MEKKTKYWHNQFSLLKGDKLLTKKAIHKIFMNANDWNICPVGCQDVRIPRRESASPIDPELYELGRKFAFITNILSLNIWCSLTPEYFIFKNAKADEILAHQNIAGYVMESLMLDIEKRAEEIMKAFNK